METIHSYTREQALQDGALVDVTEQASSKSGMLRGFEHPVVITGAVQAAIQNIPPSLLGIADERGRLHDVLWMARLSAQRALVAAQAHGEGTRTSFVVILPSRGTRQRNRTLELCPTLETGDLSWVIGFPEDF